MESSLKFSSIRERLPNVGEFESTPTKNALKKSAASSSSPSPFHVIRQKKRRTIAPLPDVQPLGSQTPMKSKTFNIRKDSNNNNMRGVQFTGSKKNTTVRSEQKIVTVSTKVEFETILRVRPLMKGEETDDILLIVPESYDNIVFLRESRPNVSSTPRRRNSKSTDDDNVQSYRFDKVIGPNSTQKEMYAQIGGISMVQDLFQPILSGFHNQMSRPTQQDLEAKNHVIISMGVSNSGKTFTLLGDEYSDGENEGLLPRLIDDIFVMSKDAEFRKESSSASPSNYHLNSNMNFELEMSMVHVHKDRIFDMLSLSSTEKKESRNSNVSKMINAFETTAKGTNTTSNTSTKELKILQDKTTQDFTLDPNVVRCFSAEKAREVLLAGMQQNTIASTKLNKRSSRGHTVVTLRPVVHFESQDFHSDNIRITGSSITVIDMAGIERTHSNDMNRLAIKESVSINASISAVLQCLRSIKSNQEASQSAQTLSRKMPQLVPYRQNKLTMIMQPLLSGNTNSDLMVNKMITNVKILASVYPGGKDYNEKKSLLSDIEPIRGVSMSGEYESNNNTIQYSSPLSTTKGRKSLTKYQGIARDLHHDDRDCALPKSISDDNTATSSPDMDAGSIGSPAQHKSPLGMLTNVVKNTKMSPKKRKAETEFLLKKVQKLEEENKHLKTKSTRIENQCKILEEEKTELLEKLEKAQRKINEIQQSTKYDLENEAEHYRQAREWRWKHHSLLASPLIEHMKMVEGGTRSTGMICSKYTKSSPFKLHLPVGSRRIETSDDENLHSVDDIEDFDTTCSDQDSASA